jgi:hypothetical protein
LLLPLWARAVAPRARTYALLPLEQGRVVSPNQAPGETRQPVAAYLRLTADGWRLDFLPGAVSRTGPLPALTQGADAAPEDASSPGLYPYAPLLRIDF